MARARRPKVKSGCRTCKLRKVKCDEARPACQRCCSTGRACDGYGVWGGGGNTYILQPSTSQNLVKQFAYNDSHPSVQRIGRQMCLGILDLDEHIGLEWYIRRTAIKLPGAFLSDHWTAVLFQMSCAEPTVMHAILALSSAHKKEVYGTSIGCQPTGLEVHTLQQYNKAIGRLQAHLSRQCGNSISVALLSCALLVSLEFFCGHFGQGIMHLQHGLRILQLGIWSDKSPSYVDGWIITLFTRLLVQSRLLGQDLPSFLQEQDLVNTNFSLTRSTFATVHQARRVLDHILLRILLLVERRSESSVEYLRDSQLQLGEDLHNWGCFHNSTVNTLLKAASFLERFAYRLMRIYQTMATIMVDTLLDTTETRYDRYTSDFTSIISQVIESYHYIHARDRNSSIHEDVESHSDSSTTAEMGWIPPLYYTATKCRNHRIRLHAIKLLEAVPHREGIWDAELAAVIGRKVTQLEERDFYANIKTDDFELLAVPESQEIALPTLPAVYRLSKVEVILPDDMAGNLEITCHGKQFGSSAGISTMIYDLPSKRWSTSGSKTKPNLPCLTH